MTDTSTPPSADSSAPADSAASADATASADASAAAASAGAEEGKKSESVASDGDLFRQSEIAADYVEGLLDILDYDGDIDELVSAG
ncbi:single-stranded DNA-binding protein, partial [Actinoplanes utahensis]